MAHGVRDLAREGPFRAQVMARRQGEGEEEGRDK